MKLNKAIRRYDIGSCNLDVMLEIRKCSFIIFVFILFSNVLS